MKSTAQNKLLHDLNDVLEKYSITEYNSEAVIEILSRSLKRKPKEAQEFYVSDKITPAEILKEQRKRMGFTLDKLSKLTKISKSNLSAMENNRRPIGLKIAKILSSALGVDYKVLL